MLILLQMGAGGATLWNLHRGVRTCGVLWLFWLLSSIAHAPALLWHAEHRNGADDSFRLTHALVIGLLLLAELILASFADEAPPGTQQVGWLEKNQMECARGSG